MVITCRNCRSEDSIASVEEVMGTCAGTVTQSKEGHLEFEGGGYTRIEWDTAKTTAYACLECGTTAKELVELVEWR